MNLKFFVEMIKGKTILLKVRLGKHRKRVCILLRKQQFDHPHFIKNRPNLQTCQLNFYPAFFWMPPYHAFPMEIPEEYDDMDRFGGADHCQGMLSCRPPSSKAPRVHQILGGQQKRLL